MRERALRVGKPTPLVAVATEPAELSADRPALLILNSGIMHHVGSCRLSVKLARAVAARGVLAIRFDFSGIGDSEPRPGGLTFEEASVLECQEVMAHLSRTRGVNEFILYGLCSGADASYHTALADARVVAISQFDPYCYVTAGYYLHHYAPAAMSLSRWRTFLRNRWRRLRSNENRATPLTDIDGEFMELPSYTRVFPPREAVARGLQTLVDRGVRLQVNFPWGPLYNHAGQFRASFRDVDFRDRLEVNYYNDGNHIVTQPSVQSTVVSDISSWVAKVASGDARSPAPADVGAAAPAVANARG